MNKPADTHLLVFRFSAMGDVAMTVPVIMQLMDQYPDLKITFVSEEKFMPLFTGLPRLDFFGADIRSTYKGITGLYKLYRQLKKRKHIFSVADHHNVLRTKVLSFFFRLSGIKVTAIDKGRKEKKLLAQKNNKHLVQLEPTFLRYAKVFSGAGFPVSISTIQKRIKLPVDKSVQELVSSNDKIKIGIAPFAKHKEKMYPVDEMEKVIAALITTGYKLFFFGGGANETNQLVQWEKEYTGTVNVAGKLSLEEELVLISRLDLMISMDSANMHLASLYGVPVVSIWGATHPFAGFYGFGQNPENIVQADLYCRPCSVFGNKKCYRGDWACMHMINPIQVVEKVEEALRHAVK